MTPAARARAPRGHGDLLRDEILAATEALLIETGSEEAVSIRAIADAVGVTPPSIYRHFDDKDHLIFEVCARHFRALDDAIEAAVTGVEDPALDIVARGRAYIRFGLAHPEHYRIMFLARSSLSPERWLSELMGETSAFVRLVDGLDRAIEQGAVEPIGDTVTTALHLWAAVHGITALLVAKPELPWPDLDQMIEDHLARLVRGLAPASAPAPPLP